MLCRVAELAIEFGSIPFAHVVVAFSRSHILASLAIPLFDRHPGAIVKRAFPRSPFDTAAITVLAFGL